MKQLKFIYRVIISISLLSSNVFCDAPTMPQEEMFPGEMDLMKLTDDLMNAMTPEQRAEVDKELEFFTKLDQAAQDKYLEDKFKELSAGIEEAEALQKADEVIPEEPEEEIKKIEPKPKIIKSELTKIEQVNETLKKITRHVEPLLIKTRILPQVSKDTKIETIWLALSDSLIELNSFAKVILPKENLIDALASDEFVLLRDQLKRIANNLEENEPNISVADTAGLTINYDLPDEKDEEEADEDSDITKTAQSKLSLLIPNLKSLIEDEQVLWGLKRVLQKYAPEELKKVEAENKAEKKYIAEFKPGKETPSNISPKYNDPFFPYYNQGGGYNPSFAPSADDKPALSGSSDKSKSGGKGKGGDKGKSEDKDKKGDKDKKKDKKDDKNKDKEKSDKKDKPKPSDTSLTELQTALDNISKIAAANNILDFVTEGIYGPEGEVIESTEGFGPKTEAQTLEEDKPIDQQKEFKAKSIDVDSRELLQPFIQINMNYTKAEKALAKLNSSLKTQPSEKKDALKKEIGELLSKPELNLSQVNLAYNALRKKLAKKTGPVNPNAEELTMDQKLHQEVSSALKSHKELKDLADFKQPKPNNI